MPATLTHDINGIVLTGDAVGKDHSLHHRDYTLLDVAEGVRNAYRYIHIQFKDESFERVIVYPCEFAQRLFIGETYQFDNRGIPVVPENRVP